MHAYSKRILSGNSIAKVGGVVFATTLSFTLHLCPYVNIFFVSFLSLETPPKPRLSLETLFEP